MDIQALIGIFTQQGNTFWQANFWGILGSITGIVGLIVSWFSFKYNTPKITVEETHLIIPDWVARDWNGRILEELKNSVLEFELEITVRNERGGSGSIDKPVLLISIPEKTVWRFFTKRRIIKIQPVTEHTEWEKESENVTKAWVERHGRAFNLSGGEKVDEKLTYQTYRFPKNIMDYVNNFDNAKYYIEYRNNFGKKRREKIKNILNKTDLYND